MAGFTGADIASARNTLFPPDDPSQIWPSNNPVGTETVQNLGMPQPTTYAGPVGQFIDPSTGQMTAQGQARMTDNPALGFDTGGLSTGGLLGMIKAYHGSSHQFDAFDMSKIGTGEGAQAYGHGMYLAENEGVARSYRDQLARDPRDTLNEYLAGIRNFHDPGDPAINADAIRTGLARHDDIAMRQIAADPQSVNDIVSVLRGYDAARGSHTDEAMNAFGRLDKVMPPKSKGHMYEVNVNADPEKFLHWDKPLSEQHPDVIKALNNTPYPPHDMRMTGREYLTALETNREMASKQGDPAAMASEALRQAGIPGIRYLDQGSRGAGEGSHNYVVFDANTMNIIRRYGLAGLMAGGGAAALGGTQGQSQ
jgi:hypothetical protein